MVPLKQPSCIAAKMRRGRPARPFMPEAVAHRLAEAEGLSLVLAPGTSSRAPIQAAVIEHWLGLQPQSLLMQSSAVPALQPMTGEPQVLYGTQPSQPAAHISAGYALAGRPLLLTLFLSLILPRPQPQS